MSAIDYAPATPEQFRAASALLRRSLDFRAADAIPPWLMLTVAEHGGLCLVAMQSRRVVGASFALPAGSRLFSCGLAVAPSARGHGVGRALKLAQRAAARERGFTAIEWTTDPLNGAALRLYLDALGARITAYHAGLYDPVRRCARLPQDDVTIAWELDGERPCVGDAARVIVPWTATTLPLARWTAWRTQARAEMTSLLERGWVGTGVEAGADGTAAVIFQAPRRG